MTKIFLLASTLIGNMAASATLACSTKILRESIPDADFKMLTFSPQHKQEAEKAQRYGVEVIKSGTSRQFAFSFLRSLLWATKNKVGINFSFLLNDRLLQEFKNADIIIDTRGITFSDFFPSWKSYLFQGMLILTAVFLKKPYVKFPQDMGPFENRVNRMVAKTCLKRVSLIIARGAETKALVQALGISNKPVYVRPDLAFALEPSDIARVNDILRKEGIDKRPLIGVVASRQIERLLERMYPADQKAQNRYAESLARTIDNIIEKLSAQIVLIPNEINELGKRPDDVYTSRKIYEMLKDRTHVRTIATNEYCPEEVKGIIGACDLVISSRFHSCLFATSMGVPCLVIGWGHKYDQIMGMMGQGEYVLDFEKTDFAEIQAKLEKLWVDREKVKAELARRMPFIKKATFSSGKLVKNLLDKG